MAGTTILRGPMIRFAGDPFTGDALVHESDGAVAIRDRLIVAAGPAGRVLADHPGAAVERTAHLIAPGFVDAHVHYPQIGIVASWGADLIDWLNGYTFPEEARFADPVHAASAARAYFDEQLRNGITCAASFCTIHAASVDAYFEEAAHSLKGEPHVVDIRNIGLAAGVTVETRPGAPGARGTEIFLKTYENGVAIRANGDNLAIAPILTMGKAEIDQTIEALRKGLRAAA